MHIEERIEKIEERNVRVQAEKAWETSALRIVVIMLITYIIASGTLFMIGNDNPLRNALIPVLGYFLSVQSLPFIKNWWISKYLKKQNNT